MRQGELAPPFDFDDFNDFESDGDAEEECLNAFYGLDIEPDEHDTQEWIDDENDD